jgi:hypothetical protein
MAKDPMESKRKRNKAMKQDGLSRRERQEMNTWIRGMEKDRKKGKQPQSSGCAVTAIVAGLSLAGTVARMRGLL